MEQSFFPEKGRWYRGNIHSHTTRTDGLCPPAQQIRDYSEQDVYKRQLLPTLLG